jgi:PleD family two-component response regulator
MGIATFPQDADCARELVDKADKALYLAKREGKNRVAVWDGEGER